MYWFVCLCVCYGMIVRERERGERDRIWAWRQMCLHLLIWGRCARAPSSPFCDGILLNCWAHFSVGVGLRKTSTGPLVMTRRVLRMPTHPSPWNSDRTKGTAACGKKKNLCAFVCLHFCVSAWEGIPGRKSACVCAHVCVSVLSDAVHAVQCPTTAAPCTCGFNLYLSFNMLHSAQYAQ